MPRLWPWNKTSSNGSTTRSLPKLYNVVLVAKQPVLPDSFVKLANFGFWLTSQKVPLSNVCLSAWDMLRTFRKPNGFSFWAATKSRISRILGVIDIPLAAISLDQSLVPDGNPKDSRHLAHWEVHDCAPSLSSRHEDSGGEVPTTVGQWGKLW